MTEKSETETLPARLRDMALWIYSEDQSVLRESADALEQADNTTVLLGQAIRARAEAEKANEVLRLLIRDLEAEMRTWKELEKLAPDTPLSPKQQALVAHEIARALPVESRRPVKIAIDAVAVKGPPADTTLDEIERLSATVARLTADKLSSVESAYQRGVEAERARLLARVRELPSPWRLERSWTDADGGDIDDDPTWRRYVYACGWCGCSYHFETSRPWEPDDVPAHPESLTCLWVEATASGPSAPPANTPKC